MPQMASARAPLSGRADVAELLELFDALPVHWRDADPTSVSSPRSAKTIGLPLPEQASAYAIDAVARDGKRLLASNAPIEERQAAVAALSANALSAGRARSSRLAFELAARRVGKWRATNSDAAVDRRLVQAGLLATVATRDRDAYERILGSSQDSWDIDLTAEPTLLSCAMIACAEAGWEENARAINASLHVAGSQPTLAACNAWLAMRLREGDTDGVIDSFVHMRLHGPRPDRISHALAAQAAATRKATWSGLRNLMRRNWLKIPWNPHAANAALSAYVRAGNLRAAAGVVSHMATTKMALRREGLEALLWHASVRCKDAPTSIRVFEALRRHAEAEAEAEEPKGGRRRGKEEESVEESEEEASFGKPAAPPPTPVSLGAAPLLLVLPHLPPSERARFCVDALSEGLLCGADEVTMQAALALVAASEGRASDSVAWLSALLAEGVAMKTLDSDGGMRVCGHRTSGTAASAGRTACQSSPCLLPALLDLRSSPPLLTLLLASTLSAPSSHSSAALSTALNALLPAADQIDEHSIEALLESTSSPADLASMPPAGVLPSEAREGQAARKGQQGEGQQGEGKGEGEGEGEGAATKRRRRRRKQGGGGGGGSAAKAEGVDGMEAGAAAADSSPPAAAPRRVPSRPAGGESLWVLAMRACGSDVGTANAILKAMEESRELEPTTGKGIDATVEYLRVCGRAKDPHAAIHALRSLGGAAPAEAYVSALTTITSSGTLPEMGLATSTLDLMEAAGAFATASASQLLRLYVALVDGYGRSCDLDAAHGAFEEGVRWLDQAQQAQVRQQEEAKKRRAQAEVEAARAAGFAVGDVVASGAGGGAGAGAASGAGAESESGVGKGGGDEVSGGLIHAEWGEAEWLGAERALHRVMVEAAAPHPRGLLLACTLLEGLNRNSGQRLKHGYYSQLISGHATANELHLALGALQGAKRVGVSSSGWRVGDATIATLMDALQRQAGRGDGDVNTEDAWGIGGAERARADAVATLSDAGLQMDRRVSEYLASGSEMGGGGRKSRRRARQVNANDDLVESERSGRGGGVEGYAPGISAREDELRSARRIAAAGISSDGGGEGGAAPPPSAKVQYDEFEKLLAQREERPHKAGRIAGEPQPAKDTKQRVDARRLHNLGNLRGNAGNLVDRDRRNL